MYRHPARRDDAADDVEHGRLARAVRSEQREDLAPMDREVDALQGLEAARVVLAESAVRDDRRRSRPGARASLLIFASVFTRTMKCCTSCGVTTTWLPSR